MESELLSTQDSLRLFLDCLHETTLSSPLHLYVDLEGNNLSRRGTISLVTILPKPGKKVHLVDVTQLKSSAFETAGAKGLTLRSILEAKDIVKIFFDIRNDSDALYSLYGVQVDGIEDLQLMELASRNFSKRCVNGLAKCIERDADMSFVEKCTWRRVKEQGHRLFDPKEGGAYEIFDRRPLSDEMMQYCCQDVAVMPHLRKIYRQKLCDAWWLKIQTETDARIRLSQSAHFKGKGQHMAMGPANWTSWRPTYKQRQSRALLQPSELATRAIQHSQNLSSAAGAGVVTGITASLQGLMLSPMNQDGRCTPAPIRHDTAAVSKDPECTDIAPTHLTGCNSGCGHRGGCDH